MTSTRGAVTGTSLGEAGQVRLEIMRQLHGMTAHAQFAAVLSARADRAANPHLAAMLGELADRRRRAAERSRRALMVLRGPVSDLDANDGRGFG